MEDTYRKFVGDFGGMGGLGAVRPLLRIEGGAAPRRVRAVRLVEQDGG